MQLTFQLSHLGQWGDKQLELQWQELRALEAFSSCYKQVLRFRDF